MVYEKTHEIRIRYPSGNLSEELEIRRNAPIETRSAAGNHGLLRSAFLLFAQALANRRTSLRDKKLYLAETLDKTGFLR